MLATYHVPFDAEYSALVHEKVEAFWRDHVEARVPPLLEVE